MTREVTTPRADIVDRNGVVLATTVDRYHIGVNQQLIAKWMPEDSTAIAGTGAIEAAKILAPILGIEEKELAAKLVGDSTWVYIAKDVTPEMWDLVNAEGISGVEPESVSQRIYPNGAIAGNVIGFVGGLDTITGTTGVAGLEREFQDELTGTPGSETFENGGSGTLIPTGVHTETAAIPGKTLVTSIDRDIQWFAQQRLAEAVRNTGASRATVVVSDVKTGADLRARRLWQR